MSRKSQGTSDMRLWMQVVLLAALTLAAGAIIGSTGNSFGFGSEKSVKRLMEQAVAAMDRGMNDAHMTGDCDHDFAAMMIPHHQGAVEMAKVELLYGRDPALRRLAQEIITRPQEDELIQTRSKQFKKP